MATFIQPEVVLDPLNVYTKIPPPRMIEAMGLLPSWIVSWDGVETLQEHFNREYAHGGGWVPMAKWIVEPDGRIQYPADENKIYNPLARFRALQYTVYIYESAWVAIVPDEGEAEVARMN